MLTEVTYEKSRTDIVIELPTIRPAANGIDSPRRSTLRKVMGTQQFFGLVPLSQLGRIPGVFAIVRGKGVRYLKSRFGCFSDDREAAWLILSRIFRRYARPTFRRRTERRV